MELKADLFPRYKNDGEIPWKMNTIQLKFREEVLKKINNNIYIY